MMSLSAANFHPFPEMGEWHVRGANGSLTINPDAPADLLSLVTIIGSSMSLVGLVFGFLVHSLFSDVRSVASTGLMNMLATLFVAQVLFIAQVEKARSSHASVCMGLAYSLRFFWLAIFCWNSALVHHLWRSLSCPCHAKSPQSASAAVTATAGTNADSPPPSTPDSTTPMVAAGNSVSSATALLAFQQRSARQQLIRHVLAYSIWAWGLPLILVLIVALTTESSNQAPRSFRSCWLLSSGPFKYAFDIPVSILTVLNFYMYARITKAIRHLASLHLDRKGQQRTRRRRFRQLLLHIKLQILLILVWLCGVASELSTNGVVWCVFVIAFSLQGGLLALVYACNVRVMKIYVDSLGFGKRRSLKKGSLKQSLAHTASMEMLTADPLPQTV